MYADDESRTYIVSLILLEGTIYDSFKIIFGFSVLCVHILEFEAIFDWISLILTDRKDDKEKYRAHTI